MIASAHFKKKTKKNKQKKQQPIVIRVYSSMRVFFLFLFFIKKTPHPIKKQTKKTIQNYNKERHSNQIKDYFHKKRSCVRCLKDLDKENSKD